MLPLRSKTPRPRTPEAAGPRWRMPRSCATSAASEVEGLPLGRETMAAVLTNLASEIRALMDAETEKNNRP